MKLECAERTHVGLVREMNQDSLLVMREQGVFLVADGMGGEMAGDEASAQVVASVRKAVEEFFRQPPTAPRQIEGLLRDTLQQANQDVFQISVREPEKRGLGSTASLLSLHRGIWIAAQVGDSRIYLLREGQVRQLTRDHTIVWVLYEQGMITRDQLETHPERHLLTQCIGNQRPVRVDTFEDRIQVGDVFLLCSDGLTGYAGEDKVFAILSDEKLALGDRADRLIHAALDAGGGDNVTAVLVRVAELDADDNWQPEATAPPTTFELGEADTISDENEPVSRKRYIREQERRRKRLGALLFLLALAIGAFAAWHFMQPHVLELALPQLGGGGAYAVEVHRNGKPIDFKVVDKTENGMRIELPRGGEYELTVLADGYLPVRHAVENFAPLTFTAEQFKPMGRLIVHLPEKPRATRLRLTEIQADGKAREILLREGSAIEGSSFTLPIEAGLMHRLTIFAEGHESFTYQAKLNQGDERTVRAYFRAVGGATPRPMPEAAGSTTSASLENLAVSAAGGAPDAAGNLNSALPAATPAGVDSSTTTTTGTAAAP